MTSEVLTPETAGLAGPAEGRLLLRGPVGSTAYGLDHAGSDVDRLGCYLAPTSDVLGLSGPWVVSRSQVTSDPDQTLHELGKFAALALAMNPTVTELLWLEHYDTRTPHGDLLVAHRDAFLSEPLARSAYGGYALQQARKLSARHAAGKEGFGSVPVARVRKHGRHCLRLLRQGTHLLATGHLMVNVAHLREELFAAGELAASDPAGFTALFEAEFARFNDTVAVLPEQPDRARVDALVVQIRAESLA